MLRRVAQASMARSLAWRGLTWRRAFATDAPSPPPTAASLRAALASLEPSHVDVEDTSGGCGSFFRLTVHSEQFQGKTTLQQHRLVNALLQKQMGALHGITLDTKAV